MSDDEDNALVTLQISLSFRDKVGKFHNFQSNLYHHQQ